MEIVLIFDTTHSEQEGLYAIRYTPGDLDEIERLFDLWNDESWLAEFASANLKDLPGEADENQINRFILSVKYEAQELLELLYEYDHNTNQNACSLQELFKPLVNSDGRLFELQASKTSARTRNRPHPLLRIYGVRINANTYVVTGGCIKLTQFMDERDHTKEELNKLNRVRDWLKANEVSEPEDLENLTDEQQDN